MALELDIGRNLACGWAAGLAIGAERSFNGRAAGLRTHALVGLAAAAVASLAMAPLLSGGAATAPWPLAQGVMTGIGFLGAGVIFKEGVSVQGLTTAASIWATAAVGLLFGVGMRPAGAAVATLVLVTLTVLRLVEDGVLWPVYAQATFRFDAAKAPSEADLGALLGDHAITLREASYRLTEGGTIFEYVTLVKAGRPDAFTRLAQRLGAIPGLIEYDVSRISK